MAVYIPWSYGLGGLTFLIPADKVKAVDLPVDRALSLALTAWVKATKTRRLRMSEPTQRTTAAKALRVNLDLARYGAFAEIGAGQEVARHFFQAGKASQTIAKSMSAYDMTYSMKFTDAKKNGRYVCESRS